jgi:hypothetical protein
MQPEIVRVLKAVPFHPFVIIMDSGERVVIRHLENIAYDPERETANCYALSDGIMHILPWEKIAHVALADTGQLLPHSGDNVA